LPRHLDIGDPEKVATDKRFKQVVWLRNSLDQLKQDDDEVGETLRRLFTITYCSITTFL
jgi:hypothetical protein